MPHWVETKTALLQAIRGLDHFYFGRSATEPLSSARLLHVELGIRIARASLIVHQQSTCVLSETLSPDQVALWMLLIQGRVSPEDVIARRLLQPDFNRLTWAAAKLASAPLHLFALPPIGIDELSWELLEFTRAHQVQVLVCERRSMEGLASWRDELEFLSHKAGMHVHLLAGEAPAAARFTPGLGQRA